MLVLYNLPGKIVRAMASKSSRSEMTVGTKTDGSSELQYTSSWYMSRMKKMFDLLRCLQRPTVEQHLKYPLSLILPELLVRSKLPMLTRQNTTTSFDALGCIAHATMP